METRLEGGITVDQKSLMDLLNIKPKEIKADGLSQGRKRRDDLRNVSTPDPLQQSAESAFALQLNSYEASQGGKLLRHNHHLRETGLEPEAISDLYALNFLPTPQTVESCVDKRRLEFITQTLETPDYLALHRSCELNPVASEIATIELSKSFAKLREEDKKREEKQEENKKKGGPINQTREDLKAEIDCMKAVCKGLKNAEKEVEDCEEMMSALGCGPGSGHEGKLDAGKVAKMFEDIKNNEQLRRIMELAGKYRRVAQGNQKKKSIHGIDDIIGVVLDGDVGRLLPHELGMLTTPEFELDAMRRLIEKQSMCREYRGVEKIGRGGIIVVVDESGSMSGEPIAQAKAFALAMCWIAKHQNRHIALVGFSGGREGNRLLLPPNKWDESKLLEWLVHFYSGGTSCDCPCEELPKTYYPEFLTGGMKRTKTDLIIITDALVHLPTETEKSFNKWRLDEKIKCVTMLIGQTDSGDLKRISDEVYPMTSISLDQPGIQKCLSI